MIRLCLALVLCISGFQSAIGETTTWAHELGDLAPDPAVHWGSLPNGLRYAIRPNAEPKGRISLRFLVKAGSLHEKDSEQGLAHFLEHMAFRSSESHPEGSLVEKLQRLGIGFGPDNTAFTTFDYTIYHLELPDSKLETLKTALSVFRIYADGLKFKEEEVELERGVVLSEMATRDTPSSRASNASTALMLPLSRVNDRKPIGKESRIASFQARHFQTFYDTWYRPERMILTLVGEIDQETGTELITEIFSSLQARTPVPPEPKLNYEATEGLPDEKVRIFRDATMTGLGITLGAASPDALEPDTRANRIKDLHGALAFHMLERRMANRAAQRGSSFNHPSGYIGSYIHGWDFNSISLVTNFPGARPAIRIVEQELRRAIEFGFTESELRKAKTYYTTNYKQNVLTADTQPSPSIATSLATSIAYDKVFSDDQTIADEMLPLVDATTLEACHTVFQEVWRRSTPKLFIGTNYHFAHTEEEVAEVYSRSQKIEVLPPEDRGEIKFAYTDFGPPGTLESKEYVEDLDLWLSKFSNGVCYNFKQTDFEADNVVIYLRVGAGRLSQPQNLSGLDILANYGLLNGGLGKHNNAEMMDILNGHVINLSFGVSSDAFTFSMSCAPRELLLAFQTLTAVLQDSAYGSEGMRSAHSGYSSFYQRLSSTPGGPIFAAAPRVLADGDLRFGVPSRDHLYRLTLDDLRSWVEPEFMNGPIEVSVAGDVDFETTTKVIAQTLGALPARSPRDPEQIDHTRIPASNGRPIITPVSDKLGQSAVAYYWPVFEVPDVQTDRRCRLLASLVEDRLRKRVREEFGAAYSVTTQFIQIDGFPHQNYFMVYAEVEPTRANEIDQLIRREIASMKREGITRDEFERTKQPYLAQRKVHLRTNSYWGYTVLHDAQQRPERLDAARNRSSDTAAITAREVQALLDQHFNINAAFVFRSVPDPSVDRIQ